MINRKKIIDQLENQEWDVLVIGGGAAGLGTAIDSASRGYKTLLIEKRDFASGTSSRSTKLIHGGVRYLKQGHFGLIKEALHERDHLLQYASHLVHPLSFVIPADSWWKSIYYYLGLKVYDFLAGSKKIKKAELLQKQQKESLFKDIQPDVLSHGVLFYDAQFDDARLAIDLVKTLQDLNGFAMNYMSLEAFLKSEEGKIKGARIKDHQTDLEYTIKAKVIVNATGVFVDDIRLLDDQKRDPLLNLSQGTHIVLDSSFYKQNQAIIIPETKDNRIVFIIPWHGYVLIGTTESVINEAVFEPKPLEQEIDFLLSTIQNFLRKKVERSDILAAFAGIRPLMQTNRMNENTANISREHAILVSNSHLVSITGGKWTTFRRIGLDAMNQAIKVANLAFKPSQTDHLYIHGCRKETLYRETDYYGNDRFKVEALAEGNVNLLEPYHKDLPCRPVDVLFAVRNEMALKLEDVLSRRTRCLLLNATLSVEIAPKVALLMAKELQMKQDWVDEQLNDYKQLAKSYIVSDQRDSHL